jgi:hypothetical protein
MIRIEGWWGDLRDFKPREGGEANQPRCRQSKVLACMQEDQLGFMAVNEMLTSPKPSRVSPMKMINRVCLDFFLKSNQLQTGRKV